MPELKTVTEHYGRGDLTEVIRSGLEKLGLTSDSVGPDDLAPVDEFHIGGRVATEHFLEQLDLRPEDNVLDLGCGLGGASRFTAGHYGCHVTGIDLTPDYIETGTILCAWVGLQTRVRLEQGSATALPYDDHSFDKAYMLHVGMNIADKAALARELFRVVKPGGKLGIYDIMRVGDGDLTFPLPWATEAEGSAVASPQDYKDALMAVGFVLLAEQDRTEFALDFFARLQNAAAKAAGPPALGLHLLMGKSGPAKIRNLIENIAQHRLAPVELIAQRPAQT